MAFPKQIRPGYAFKLLLKTKAKFQTQTFTTKSLSTANISIISIIPISTIPLE